MFQIRRIIQLHLQGTSRSEIARGLAITDRYGKHTTIITAQMPIAKWYEYIADPTIADALMDRLLHHAHRIELKGVSMRKNHYQ